MDDRSPDLPEEDPRPERQRKITVKSVNQLTPGRRESVYDARFDEADEGPAERAWLMAGLDLYDQENLARAARIIRRRLDEDERENNRRTSWGKFWTGLLLALSSAGITALAAAELPRLGGWLAWIMRAFLLPPPP